MTLPDSHQQPMVRRSDVESLPAVLTSTEAAELLRVSTDHLWKLARDGGAPVEPLRIGRSYRWPTQKLLDLLGVHHDDASDPAEEGGVVVPLTTTTERRESGLAPG